MRKSIYLLLLLLSIFSASSVPIDVNLGFIIDLDSTIGAISNTSVNLALSNFYSSHPNSTFRLNLLLRNIPCTDLVSAASAAVDLISNHHVVAILGPQTSASASFVADLGTNHSVPVVSFSATSPSLSPSPSSFYVRAAVNDAKSAKPIAAIVSYFGWRRAVVLYEDSDFGSSFLPYLVDALDAVGSQLTYRIAIVDSATDDRVLSELYRLKSMQTRVFIVHTTTSLAVKIFANAKIADMMEDGFVWIATDAITGLIGSVEASTVLDTMQGVIGVRPYINPRVKTLQNILLRWRREFIVSNPNSYVTDISTYGVWAYNAATAIANAVEVRKTNLLEELKNMRFDGLAGQFRVDDGELNITNFQIVNVVGEKGHGIGYWSERDGLRRKLERNVTDSVKLGVVMWPGESRKEPRGFVEMTSEKKLRILVPGPVEVGFHGFLSVTKDPMTNEVVAGGFVIEVFEEAVKRLPYALPVEYVMKDDDDRKMKRNYDELLKLVPKKYDGVVGDVTITANRSENVDFTLPYAVAGVSMVVPVRDLHSKTWIFLKPLKTDLWLVSGAFFVFTGFVVWVIEHRVNDEFRGPPSHQAGTVFYFAFSTLVFAHRESIVNNLTRFVVIIWVFVVFILQSSYTANLTSMLTVRRVKPTVTDLNELIRNREYVGYLTNSYIGKRLVNMGFDPNMLRSYRSPEQYADALSKGSKNGGVSAIVDEIPYLKVFLKDYCDNYAMAGPTNKTGGFGFAFPKGSSIVPDLSRAILNLTESDQMAEIERRWFGDQSQCDSSQGSKLSSDSLSFKSFWGLFLITGSASLIALLITLATFLYNNRHLIKSPDPSKSIKYKVHSIVKLYDERDLTSHTFKRGTRVSMGSPMSVTASQYTYNGGNATPSIEMASPIHESSMPVQEIAEITAANE